MSELNWTHTPGASGDQVNSEFVDHCIDCSEAANEWVPWPCSARLLVKSAVDQDRYLRSMDEDARGWASFRQGATEVRAEIRALLNEYSGMSIDRGSFHQRIAAIVDGDDSVKEASRLPTGWEATALEGWALAQKAADDATAETLAALDVALTTTPPADRRRPLCDEREAARADAWDEGARTVWEALAPHAWSLDYYLDDNPYRGEREAAGRDE